MLVANHPSKHYIFVVCNWAFLATVVHRSHILLVLWLFTSDGILYLRSQQYTLCAAQGGLVSQPLARSHNDLHGHESGPTETQPFGAQQLQFHLLTVPQAWIIYLRPFGPNGRSSTIGEAN